MNAAPTVFQVLVLALGDPPMLDADIAKKLDVDVDTVRDVLGSYRADRRGGRGTKTVDAVDGSWAWALERTTLDEFIASIPEPELALHPGALLTEG